MLPVLVPQWPVEQARWHHIVQFSKLALHDVLIHWSIATTVLRVPVLSCIQDGPEIAFQSFCVCEKTDLSQAYPPLNDPFYMLNSNQHVQSVQISRRTYFPYSALHEPSRYRPVANCKPDFCCLNCKFQLIPFLQVSKWFRAITYDPEIWKVLYANASFVRPPGPFPSQSTASLEYTLVQSTRLARSWATQPLRAVSHVEIPFHGKPTQYMNNIDLIGGRWLIVCQSKRRIVLYDTDANADKCVPQILWEQNERIGFWDKYSVISEEGQWGICVLLSEEYSRRWYVCILLPHRQKLLIVQPL